MTHHSIKFEDLQNLVDDINITTGNHLLRYSERLGIGFSVNIGTYYLEKKNGFQLLQATAHAGNPVTIGFLTKREMYAILTAYLSGLRAEKKGGYRGV